MGRFSAGVSAQMLRLFLFVFGGGVNMGWDRLGLFVAIVSMFALVITPAAWCGGPLGLGGAQGAGASSGSSFFGSGATSGAASDGSGQSALSGLGVNASYQSATANGANGASPQENLSDTGAGDATSGYNIGANYKFENLLGTGSFINLQVGYSAFNFGGNPTTYNGGNIGGGAQNGQTVSSKMDLQLANVNADLGLIGGTSGYLGSGINAGPRFQYLRYIDSFSFTNVSAFTQTDRSRSIGMFGIGAFGSMALPSFGASSSLPYGSVSPAISLAGTIGTGNGMRYVTLEAFLKLFRGNTGLSDSSVAAEIGWIYMQFKETLDSQSVGASLTSNAAYALNIPVIRGSLGF